MVDTYLSKTNQDSEYPQTEVDEADIADHDFTAASACTFLNFNQIDTIIWAIGYQAKFNYLHIPHVKSEQGVPIHTNGVSPQKGLYYIGFPWLIKRKSGIIFGIAEDAKCIAALIQQALSNKNSKE